MNKSTFRTLFALVLLATFSIAVFLIMVYRSVSREAADRIQRGIIDNIIFSESPVYYDDGKSVIGVFFENTHRKYIRYKDIPPHFIKALVAAEDKEFFHHPGFAIKAIIRAMIANIRAGKVVQGGSTLTQQTAKNVFKRERRSIRAKIKELMQALLLEREYTKEEILEMYVNQFFVTGFGRGLEIAAQYFFDKAAKDIDLVESAFIAGSVKSPNAYNPFTRKAESQKMEAMKRAKGRKDYVLLKMFTLHFITKEQYDEAVKKDVPFREGKVTYRLNVILDYVREQLESNGFRSILEELGVDNIATSGIRIHTSVNKEIQEGALQSLRYHLPLLDISLSGYSRDELQARYGKLTEKILKRQGADLPFLCRITHISRENGNPFLLLSWDQGGGIIDYEGLESIGKAWAKGERGAWAEFDRRHVKKFLENFEVGDLIAVQSSENKEKGGQISLRIVAIPELDGGVIVLKNGMVKAMIGGFFDRFFNRAIDGKRQLGSIFKPLVYAAALQLKWNILDPLPNVRELFRYETTDYLPKPDHTPQSDRVSIAWAGVKSENLATVWLLSHLTDHLNIGEFGTLVEALGLARGKVEPYDGYVKRIRDDFGVIVDKESLLEAAFEEAKRNVVSDLIFGGQEDALPALEHLHYDVDPTKLDLQNPDELRIYHRSYKRLQRLNMEMQRDFNELKAYVEEYAGEIKPDILGDFQNILHHFYLLENGKDTPKIFYKPDATFESRSQLKPLTLSRLQEIIMGVSIEDVCLDEIMASKAIQLFESHLQENYQKLLSYNWYDKEVLYKIRDFRTLTNLTYVTKFAKEVGISTPLDPVLSFPLGANAISISDAALAYHTLMTGHMLSLPEGMDTRTVPIITKIEDRTGEVIWEFQPKPKKVLSDRVSKSVAEILRMVMEHGTGKSARDSIHLDMAIGEEKISIPIPTFGKTGTANRFTNSSFVGFVPGPNPHSGQPEIEEGYTVACYVGYDDNRPMKGKRISIYGSYGALPVWIDTVNTIVNSHDYSEKLQVADLAFNDRRILYNWQESLQKVQISEISGLPISKEMEGNNANTVFLFTENPLEGEHILNYRRVFEPFIGAKNGE